MPQPSKLEVAAPVSEAPVKMPLSEPVASGDLEKDLEVEINVTKKTKKEVNRSVPVKIRIPIVDIKDRVDNGEDVIEVKGTVISRPNTQNSTLEFVPPLAPEPEKEVEPPKPTVQAGKKVITKIVPKGVKKENIKLKETDPYSPRTADSSQDRQNLPPSADPPLNSSHAPSSEPTSVQPELHPETP